MVLATAACQQAPSLTRSSPTASATVATPLTACPSAVAPSGPAALLKKLPAPDDLAFDNEGRLLYSDINAGTVAALNADGSVEKLASGLSAPEGLVVQPDGKILVAEQGRNRIDLVDPQSHALSIWRNFANRTSNAGIDGIGPILPTTDQHGNKLLNGGDIVVPDSPNGVVWGVTPDGKAATQLASGLTRPVGAAVDATDRILVADEGGALWALTPARHRLATLSTPDDVAVGPQGEIFVNTLGDNAIHQLNADGSTITVIRGLQQPQGIALDRAGNLYYTEFTAGRIDRLVRSFVLEPPIVKKVAAGVFHVCPVIGRAAGFRDPLSLQSVPANQGWLTQMATPGTDTSGALLVESTEPTVMLRVFDDQQPLELTQAISLPQ